MNFVASLMAARGFRADLVALLTGALAALALPPLYILPALLVAFPILLAQINACERPIIALRRGWWFGFGYHLVGLYWITEAILIEAARFWWLVPFAVPATSAVLAVFIAIPAWVTWFVRPGPGERRPWPDRVSPIGAAADPSVPAPATALPALSRRAVPPMVPRSGQGLGADAGQSIHSAADLGRVFRSSAAQVMALAGAWVLGDVARQFVATGFPWNPLGSVWAITGRAGDIMLQPASLISVHGLTLLTVILACAPVLRWRGRGVCLGMLLIWAAFGVYRTGEPLPPDQPLRVVLVQGNVPQGQKWDPALLNSVFDRYLHLTNEGLRAAGPGPSIAVWPETASPFQLQTDAGARGAIADASDGHPVLAGAVRFDQADRPRNSLFAITGTGAVAAFFDKWHLVPFGEYQPSWLPVGIQVVPGGGFVPGPGPETLHVPGIPPFGPLICYEAIFPGEVVSRTDRPDWMVNITNDAWFGTSSGPRQHLAAARLRAVEEGLPLMRAANTGITVAFDSRGHEITRLEMEKTGFRTVTLPGPLPPTFFARFGLAVPLVLAIGCLGLGFAIRRLR